VTRCDSEQQCRLIAHIDDRDRPREQSVRGRHDPAAAFPAGWTLVAVFDYTHLSLIDTRSMRIITVVSDFDPSPFGGGELPVQFPRRRRAGGQHSDRTSVSRSRGKTLAAIALQPASMRAVPARRRPGDRMAIPVTGAIRN
jgi:hypothetical protein